MRTTGLEGTVRPPAPGDRQNILTGLRWRLGERLLLLLLSATKVCSRHQLLPKHLSTQWHGLTMGIKKQQRSLREGFTELQMSCKKWELRWTCKKWSSRWLAPFFQKRFRGKRLRNSSPLSKSFSASYCWKIHLKSKKESMKPV